MFEAYAIGVTLKLHNLISPQLLVLSKEFKELDALTLALKQSLGKIAIDSSAFRSLTAATNSTNRALERASASAATLHRHLSAVQGSSVASSLLLPAAGGGFRSGGGGGFGGGGGGHSARGFHGGNVHMGAGGIGIGSIGMAAGDAFLPLAITAGAIYAGKSLFDSAKELDTERQRFKMFGLSDSQNNEAFKYAAGMRIYGSTQTENLRNFREAQGVFREAGLEGSAALEGAKLAAPILSKLNALDSSLDEESAGKSHLSNLSMLKWVESAGGLKGQDEFNRLANMGYRLKVGSGDTVDWGQLQRFQAKGGSSAIGMSAEGMARIEPSISTLGGATAGTALATGYGRLQGIVKNLPVSVIDELLTSGVWDKSKVALNSKGGIAKFLDPAGPLSKENSKLLSENPEGFYEQVIRPIYAKMNLDAAGVIRMNALIYGRTGGALANEWEKQLQTIQRAASAFNKTLDINQATSKLPDSLTGQQKEFDAAWTDFKTQFGTTVLPFFSGILKGGASIFRSINDGKPAEVVHGISTMNAIAQSAIGNWLESSHHKSGGSPYVAGKNSTAGGKPTQVNLILDGHHMASVMFDPMANLLGAPTSGANFDGSLSLAPVSLNQGH